MGRGIGNCPIASESLYSSSSSVGSAPLALGASVDATGATSDRIAAGGVGVCGGLAGGFDDSVSAAGFSTMSPCPASTDNWSCFGEASVNPASNKFSISAAIFSSAGDEAFGPPGKTGGAATGGGCGPGSIDAADR